MHLIGISKIFIPNKSKIPYNYFLKSKSFIQKKKKINAKVYKKLKGPEYSITKSKSLFALCSQQEKNHATKDYIIIIFVSMFVWRLDGWSIMVKQILSSR